MDGRMIPLAPWRLRAALLIVVLLALGACARYVNVLTLSRLSAPDSLACTRDLLRSTTLRTEDAPPPEGMAWRLRLMVLSSPPLGWLDKGSLMHDGTAMTWRANGATAGLEDDVAEAAANRAEAACVFR